MHGCFSNIVVLKLKDDELIKILESLYQFI